MADLSKIQQTVQSIAASTGVRDLNARANGNMVEIHGTVQSLAEKQNVMRAITEKLGDTAGVMNMIAVSQEIPSPGQPRPQTAGFAPGLAPQTSTGARTHTVNKGETLTHIAQHYYGKASEYQKIFNANRDQLSDADKIREGMTLKIP
ncbi:MAG TPA: LysM peptidoglycan-binding domain-containing protein [Thermoanaerobaculia bacterium]